MSESKNFQITEMPRNAAESRIKTDSLLQALGMMAPAAASKKKKNCKLTSNIKFNSLRNSRTKHSSPYHSQVLADGGPREKALGNDLNRKNRIDHRIPLVKNKNSQRTKKTLRNAAA
jgi:hypothetical protein